MSTRCFISKQVGDDSFKTIYCHNDGGLEGVGKILNTYYKDEHKIDKLLQLGDISRLGEKIDPESNNHSFDTPEETVTVAYHRDRGEKYSNTMPFRATLKELTHSNSGVDYIYIYDLDNNWNFIYVPDSDSIIKPL